LAHGFFEEVIARLPEKKIGEAVRVAVAAKFVAMRSLPAQQLRGERRGKMDLEEVSETLDVRALQGLAK
jgi:hypothetical protein